MFCPQNDTNRAANSHLLSWGLWLPRWVESIWWKFKPLHQSCLTISRQTVAIWAWCLFCDFGLVDVNSAPSPQSLGQCQRAQPQGDGDESGHRPPETVPTMPSVPSGLHLILSYLSWLGDELQSHWKGGHFPSLRLYLKELMCISPFAWGDGSV